jgi:hypothetical protein
MRGAAELCRRRSSARQLALRPGVSIPTRARSGTNNIKSQQLYGNLRDTIKHIRRDRSTHLNRNDRIKHKAVRIQRKRTREINPTQLTDGASDRTTADRLFRRETLALKEPIRLALLSTITQLTTD